MTSWTGRSPPSLVRTSVTRARSARRAHSAPAAIWSRPPVACHSAADQTATGMVSSSANTASFGEPVTVGGDEAGRAGLDRGANRLAAAGPGR